MGPSRYAGKKDLEGATVVLDLQWVILFKYVADRYKILKQGANSVVRFTSYATLQEGVLNYAKPASGKLESGMTFGLGAIAGLITVCECRQL